jgi:hypothetical protein
MVSEFPCETKVDDVD